MGLKEAGDALLSQRVNSAYHDRPVILAVGNVEKSRQRRSRHCVVLTYSMDAPRVKMPAALLDERF